MMTAVESRPREDATIRLVRRAHLLPVPHRQAVLGLPAPEAVATLGHELRTPLATMQASLEILGDLPALSPEDAQQLVARLQRSVAWMNGLVENLMTWSALETGQLAPGRGEVSIDECIQAALGLVQPHLARRGQRVRLSCPSPAPTVAGDALKLGQVLVNLLANASAYGVHGDTIEVCVSVSGGRVRVRVTDHGLGIAADERERIFARHARGTRGMQERASGHGLGLHIAKSLIECHGGQIGVDSTPGEGATFWFELPAFPEH